MFKLMTLIFMAVLVVGCGGGSSQPVNISSDEFEVVEISGTFYNIRIIDKKYGKICYASNTQGGGIYCFDEVTQK